MKIDPHLRSAYRYCRRVAQAHYENFPVASLLLPRRLRDPIAAIYVFARQADDIADEGDAEASKRLQQLDVFHQQLQAIAENRPTGNSPLWTALSDTIQRFNLPIKLFEDLLYAFRQDIIKTRFANLEEVLEYCRYSANPVGRLVLHLNKAPTPSQLNQSDAICTSLQLINFFQDIHQDYLENHRIYLPQDKLKQAGIDESKILVSPPQQLSQVLQPLYQYTISLMQQGSQLGLTLSGRLGFEIRAMTLGGIETLILLMKQPESQLLSRPRLSRRQHFFVMLNALSKHRYQMRINQLIRPM